MSDDTTELGLDDVVAVSEARASLGELLGRVRYGGERIGLQKHGKIVAALISAEELAVFERLQDEADVREIKRRDEEDTGERIRLGDLLDQLGVDLDQEVTAEEPQVRTSTG